MKKLVIKLVVLTALFTAFFAMTAFAAKGDASYRNRKKLFSHKT